MKTSEMFLQKVFGDEADPAIIHLIKKEFKIVLMRDNTSSTVNVPALSREGLEAYLYKIQQLFVDNDLICEVIRVLEGYLVVKVHNPISSYPNTRYETTAVWPWLVELGLTLASLLPVTSHESNVLHSRRVAYANDVMLDDLRTNLDRKISFTLFNYVPEAFSARSESPLHDSNVFLMLNNWCDHTSGETDITSFLHRDVVIARDNNNQVLLRCDEPGTAKGTTVAAFLDALSHNPGFCVSKVDPITGSFTVYCK